LHTAPDTLRLQALDLGFDLFGIAAADTAPHAAAFLEWIDQRFHADMDWIARDPVRRTDPRHLLPDAQSIVMVGMHYHQGANPRNLPGLIARYAWGRDYHDLLLQRLQSLANTLAEQGGTQKIYVDTGPLLERDFAALAGLGWQSKSTMLIHPRQGAWFFLGAILTTLSLPPSQPITRDHCGRCRRCIDACPTRAITENRSVDARRCIAWLTIENKEGIPHEFRRAIGDRLYGCDECIDVCPWNRFARQTREASFHMPSSLATLPLRDSLTWDETTFRTFFKGSPIKRLKLRRWIRNVCIVLGNRGDLDDLPALHHIATGGDPLLAEHASWAITEIHARHP